MKIPQKHPNKKIQFIIDVQYASSSKNIPDKNNIKLWANTCLNSHYKDAELTIRIVDESEIIELNNKWRGFNKTTNVLSFPAGNNPVIPEYLGDIAICADVISREAIEQNKQTDEHWAHMVIHGILHLLGYDHINDIDAEKMESLEIKILRSLNYPNPYE